MQLILHIGTNQTGANTIQKFLRENRTNLKDMGVCYPLVGTTPVGSHHHIISSFCQNPHMHYNATMSAKDFMNEIVDESIESRAVVISSELMNLDGNFDKALFKKLALDAGFDSFKIVVYLKRQDLYAESFYNSRLKAGEIGDDPFSFSRKLDLDYFKKISSWESVFEGSDIVVRLFEKEKLDPRFLIKDFLSVLDVELCDDLLPDDGFIFESRNRFSEIFLEHSNRYKTTQEFRNFIVRFFEVRYPGCTPSSLTVAQRQRILLKYKYSNAELGRKYFGGAYHSPFESLDLESEKNDITLQVNDLIDLSVEIANGIKYQ